MYARIAVTAATMVALALLVPLAIVDVVGLVDEANQAARVGMGVAAVTGVLCGFVGGRVMARIVLAEWQTRARAARKPDRGTR